MNLVPKLAEVQWTWRRGYIWFFSLAGLTAVGVVIWKINDPAALKSIAFFSQCLLALYAILYVAGATATDIARLAAAVKGGTPPPEESQ